MFTDSTRFQRLMSAGLRPVMLAATIVLWPLLTEAQTTPAAPKPLPEGLLAAERLLANAYPELRQRRTAAVYTPVGEQWVVRVSDPPAPGAPSPAPLVEATVALDVNGRLKSFRATGAILDDTRNNALWEQMKAHPEWDESDADIWLQQVGGRSTVGRSKESVATLKADEWQPLLGSAAEVVSARFRWRSVGTPKRSTPALGQGPVNADRLSDVVRRSPPPPPILATRPSWLVEVVAQDDAGKRITYQFEYEPFGGRLIGVVRQ